jgi:uridine kinase
MARPIILGVVGDSATGKTTITKGLVEILGRENVTHIGMDGYHRYDREERAQLGITPLKPECNYMDIIEQHLGHLRRDEPILKPVYGHGDGRFGRPEYVEPKPFVVVEGLLGNHTAQLSSQFDVRVYLAPPEELRREWKIKRNSTKRGYIEEQVLEELDRREPDSDAYIRPQKSRADLVVSFHPGAAADDDHLDAVLTLRDGLPHPDLSVKGRARRHHARAALLGALPDDPRQRRARARSRDRGGDLGEDALRAPHAHRAARHVHRRRRRGPSLRAAGDHAGADPLPPRDGEGLGGGRRRRRCCAREAVALSSLARVTAPVDACRYGG